MTGLPVNHLYVSLSSFFIILPYLVLITLLCPLSLLLVWLFIIESSLICSPSSPLHPLIILYTLLHFINVLMLLFCPLSVLLMMLDTNGGLSSCVRMLSSRSVFVCLFNCSWRYHSVDIGVGFMCCLLHVIVFPVVMMQILYNLLWCLWSPFSSMVPWVHGPPSSHWTTTVDTTGRGLKVLEVSSSLSFLYCPLINALWCSSSLSAPIGGLFTNGIMPLIGQLNNIVAELQRPCPRGVILICNRAMWGSLLDSKTFL